VLLVATQQRGKDVYVEEILVWDISAFRKHAMRILPDLKPADLNAHWQTLSDADPNKAFKAMRRLAASPKQAQAMLKDRLKPLKYDRAEIAAAIAQLDSGVYADRKKAEDRLLAISYEALPALEQARKKKQSLEFNRRVDSMIEKIHQDTRRALWAIEMLEFLGPEHKDARAMLERLAQGTATAWVTLEAQKSVDRLKK
jgi:hypothetical protein